ncbi:phosphohydrolase [Paenibacillus faecis]|uniref:HD-GYP domain-containing protein n=1 Tax=Paenibacillus TaxID=44249 RepID=UPI001B2830B9|nr:MULTISPECIES: HD domain-containing phosphohydrolase [Paenibacillus]MCA1292470.1 HD domain-containing protein [Paenibacillus sp. alder61]GIO86898.1 phosphohydrolase [Paenibacillus faecis]
MNDSDLHIERLNLNQDPDAAMWLRILLHKHPEVYYHSSRVAMLAEKIAEPLELSDEETRQLVRGCFLHDIGKSVIPRETLTQREPFTSSQWDLIKQHPIVGARMAESNPGFSKEIVQIIRHHHERWDGRGYPDGLSGEEIPLGARICAVIDAFDSMTSNKVYRRSIQVSEARLELIRYANVQFDPDVVHAMVKLPIETLSIFSL